MEKIIVGIIYLLYILLDRNILFKVIYTGLFFVTFQKLIKFLFIKDIKITRKITSIIKYILTYFFTYFFIKDPNPFYHLLTFYLPLPNFFRALFIIIFTSYIMNNYIYNNNDRKIKEDKNKNYFFLSKELNYLFLSKKKLFLVVFLFILLKIFIYLYKINFWIYFYPKSRALPLDTEKNTKYYISAVIFNMEPSIEDWITQMKLLIYYLGPENILLSIIENGDSTDNTRFYLSSFKSYLDKQKIPNSFILEKVIERKKLERIAYLSKLRNLSLVFLHKNKIDYSNTKIIFFNDIIYKYSDIIKLLSTNNGEYDSVCAMDFYEGFYDIWASQFTDGQYFQRYFPYSFNKVAQDAFINGEILRTFSCWNGVTVFNATPFEDEILYFRYGYKYRQSECTLLHADMYWMGYQKTLTNTEVLVAYEYEYYYKNLYLYPWTKNLWTYFYYYFKGLLNKKYLNKDVVNIHDRNIKLSKNFNFIVNMLLSKYTLG